MDRVSDKEAAIMAQGSLSIFMYSTVKQQLTYPGTNACNY